LQRQGFIKNNLLFAPGPLNEIQLIVSLMVSFEFPFQQRLIQIETDLRATLILSLIRNHCYI